ncbi:MAG: formylmethanofuran dehydrogenase subunit B [archaeon]|nr:formylmethanofuran dehydrogenase subunit B [archaeon]
MGKVELIKDVVCPFCGSNCDDIEVEVQDGQILNVYNACSLGVKTFLPIAGAERLTKPLWRENKADEFKEISWDEALDKFADIMIKAKRPLWYGWCETSVESIKEGIKLTEMTKGVIDGQVTHCHGPSVQAIQMVGFPTMTLGDVKARADTIVCWGSNPLNAHPRHMSRYTSFTRGFFREDGRKGKKIIVIDPRRTDTAKLADKYYQVELGEDYELFQALRAVLNGMELEQDVIAGLKKEEIVELAESMKNANYGMVFFGMGLTHSLGKSQNISGGIQLVQLLNKWAKWGLMPLMGHYNVHGFVSAVTWTTGYPYGVDFSRGYPRYNPGEFSTIDLLQNGQADAMFIISADPGAHLPQKCVEHMIKIPTVVCDVHHSCTTEIANLVLPGTHSGVEAEATTYRMDGIPIRMKKLIEPPEGCMISETHMLKKLVEIVNSKLKAKK